MNVTYPYAVAAPSGRIAGWKGVLGSSVDPFGSPFLGFLLLKNKLPLILGYT